MSETGLLDDKKVSENYFERLLLKNRLPHAILIHGGNIEKVQAAALHLAKILNCEKPPLKSPEGVALECCNNCNNCRRIENESHPDVHWVRPESKLRQITADSIRELIRVLQMKPLEAGWKIAIIVAADRMHQNAANAFLKTIEEPTARSLIILLSTEPHRLLETIVSRCQKINLGENEIPEIDNYKSFLEQIAKLASDSSGGIFVRYKIFDLIVATLSEIRTAVESEFSSQSPEKKYSEVELDSQLLEKLEKEIKASIEAEYRNRRLELFKAIQWFFRDVWLHTIKGSAELLALPHLKNYTSKIANRISPESAKENIEIIEECQRMLFTNVQETLIVEVTLLRLKF
ncbi:MAG: ATP-binding protein [Verrucomicrobiia bacterium]